MTAPSRENLMTSPAPINVRITTDLRERIRSGALSPGARLPTVEQLRAEYGHLGPDGTISDMPVRMALTMLRAEGLIVFAPGMGNVVAAKEPTDG
jgi:DNA-binding GntR family transcriptional regulator